MKIQVRLSDGSTVEEIISGPEAIIGRSRKCDVVVHVGKLSRQHCKVELWQGDFFITDLNSSNGVFIDGKRIPSGQAVYYSTALPLQISSLECRISDSDVTAERAAPEQIHVPWTAPSNRPASPAPSPQETPVPAKSSRPHWAWAVLALPVIAFSLYFFATKNKTPPQIKLITPVVSSKKSQQIASASDSFLTTSEYHQLKQLKNCSDHKQTCKDLLLKEKDGEGVATAEAEVFIFMLPARHAELERFINIKKSSERDKLIALHYLLRSAVFFQFLQQQVSQIHLIVQDKSQKPKLVIRLHSKYFPESFIRTQFIKELGTAISSGEVDEFMLVSRDFFQILTL